MRYMHSLDKDNAGHPYALSRHHEKAEAHQQRDGGDYADLCFEEHSTLFNVALQMLFVKPCAYEPVMQPLGAVGKAEGCC